VLSERVPGARSVAFGVWVGVGSRDERPSLAGASHFLEHLLFKGTGRRDALQIAEELDAVGGDLNAFTSKEFTCFYARVLDRDLPLAGDLLADMYGHATIAPEHVDQERQVVLEEINIHLDSPDELVHSDLATTLLGEHPLGREVLGDTETIRTMSRDRVHAYYERHYRPSNLTVAAAGNVDHDRLVELIEEIGAQLDRTDGSRPERQPPATFATGEVSIRDRPTEQAHIALGGRGLPRDDDRRFTLYVLDTLLGTGMSSRLFQAVREDRGLAYTTYSYQASYGDAGWYAAYAGTAPRNVEELLDVLTEELDQLPGSLGSDEVERAKGNLAGSMVLGLEDSASRMTRLGRLVCTGAEVLTVEESLRRIDAVELADVRMLAEAVLQAPRSLAVVGPFTADDRDDFERWVS
jgi:predicted Zn-dependent peptidase